MIEPAQRLSTVNEYYFSNKLREIEKLKQSGIQVLNLGIGNPDLPPSLNALETLKSMAERKNTHGYQSYNGAKELREAFGRWYKKYFEVSLDSDKEILPLIGSKEGIMHISMAFLNPGDGVLIPNPSYPAYSSVSKLVGANIIEFNLTEKNGWFPDLEEIEKMDLSRVKLMWVNYPNMPTGQNITLEQFKELIDFGIRHNILICNDNPYSFILNDKHLSILSTPGAKEIAIELNSLSKSHNMAGWRVGAMIGNPQYVSYVLKVKSNVDSGMFLPLQLAAAEALNCDDSWYKEINKQYLIRKKIAENILRSLNCTFANNQSGMFIWAKIPETFHDSYEFTDFLLQEKGLFITPGSIFGSNGNGYTRISLASREADLLEAEKRIIYTKNKIDILC